MKVALLSTVLAPQLGYIIKEMTAANIKIDSVLLDSRAPTDREIEIEIERTEGKLPPVPLETFEHLRIPYYWVDSHVSDETNAWIKSRNLDVLVNAGTPRIISRDTLRAVNTGVVNCHPGLLPMFRGCTVVEWALYLDEQLGNTCHFMDEGIDTGPIIETENVSVEAGDTYSDVRVRMYLAGFNLLARGMKRIIDENIGPSDLPDQGEGRYFKPIPDEKLKEAKQKLLDGNVTPSAWQ